MLAVRATLRFFPLLDDSDSEMGLTTVEFGPTFVIPADPLWLTFGIGGLYISPTEGDADPAFGFYVSGGLRGVMSNGMEWFAEVQYADVEGDENTTTTRQDYPWGYIITTRSDPFLDFSVIGANVGLLWHL